MLHRRCQRRLQRQTSKAAQPDVFMKDDWFLAAPLCCDLKTHLMADPLNSSVFCFHGARHQSNK